MLLLEEDAALVLQVQQSASWLARFSQSAVSARGSPIVQRHGAVLAASCLSHSVSSEHRIAGRILQVATLHTQLPKPSQAAAAALLHMMLWRLLGMTWPTCKVIPWGPCLSALAAGMRAAQIMALFQVHRWLMQPIRVPASDVLHSGC